MQLDISIEASQWIAEGASHESRMQAARGEIAVEAGDLGSVLLYLSHDRDPDIASAAINSIRGLSGERLNLVLEAPETHPYLLEILARLHFHDAGTAELIASHPATPLETLEFLSLHGVTTATEFCGVLNSLDETPEGEQPPPDEEEIEVDEEEYKSKYQLAQSMGVAEKIKMALTGDKEWRGLLIKDSNKLVSGGVMKNPRITDGEVLTIAKSAVQNDEIIRAICANKEWIKNYNIRKAMVENSKTPLPHALRFMASLSEKDLAGLAKSKNVSSVIATQARRLLLNKNKK
ncbi:hypothetical protein OR1_03920 [Geobacter sp. OR-1]|uniref:hypothetical protein n=1 Tax=Geobacter sp. OR-1 TaxID=1266765 RepID=UPI00054376FF|nr:hypothetical protein [Geobacter sp. OR-1]GAM11604.1 hypothetical protein OR1_03920 [Geobacter sp. OR-1]